MRRVLAAVLILGTCLATAALSQSFFRKAAAPAAPAATRANPSAARTLGKFVRIDNTPFLFAPIESERDGSHSYSVGFSSGKMSGPLHNYAVLDLTDQSIRRLIPTNDFAIVGLEKWPATGDTGSGFGSAGGPVRWLSVDVVKQDTNRDGVLDGDDLRTLAVAEVSGRGYTELIGGIKEVYGQALSGPDTLVVVYQGAGTKSVAVIDMSKRVVTSTTAVPDLGPDVK